MKQRLARWRERYWMQRSPAERRILGMGALLLTPLFFYFLLWQPAHQSVAKLMRQLPALRVQAAQLHQQAAEIEALRHRPQLAQLDATAIRQLLEETAARHQLRPFLAQIEVQPPNAVRISSEAISFADWLVWVRELQGEQKLRVESVALSALPEAGRVKLTATFSSGNPQ